MSWLKEIENLLAKQTEEDEAKKRAEQLAKEREERERIERIEAWEESPTGQLLKKLLTRWDEWEIDKTIAEIRDLVWPRSKIDELKVVLDGKYGDARWEISLREEKTSRAWQAFRHSYIKSADIFEAIEAIGISPEHIRDLHLEREILHGDYRYRFPSRGYPEGGYERVGDVTDFLMLLDERRLDETPTLEGFKETIVQRLKDKISRD